MTDATTAPERLSFGSFAELRRWHSEQMKPLRAGGLADTVPGREGDRTGAGIRSRADTVRAYVHAIQASGAVMSCEEERLSAQDILDYWSAELFTAAPAENLSWSPPRLADFVPPEDGSGAPDSTPAAPSDEARARIRLAASARLWRDSGQPAGYLLFGRALAEAERFMDDRDIAELVKSSQAAERRKRNRRTTALWVAVTIAVGCVAAGAAWLDGQKRVEGERFSRKLAETSERDASRSLAEMNRKYMDAEAANRLNSLFADFLNNQIEEGRIQRSEVPDAIKPALAQLAGLQPAAAPPAATPDVAGYVPQFLGVALPMPAHADGAATLAYPNFSVLMHRSRRMAIVTAANVDRQALRALPRTNAPYACDTRYNCGEQADPQWFQPGAGFDRGHLVPRNLVAWGPAIEALPPLEASSLIAGAVNRLPNITPQFDTFNRGVWDGAERWALEQHNSAAPRLVVLSGPVLRDDDPVVAGVKTPRAFWKVVVSNRLERVGGLVVDAFMIGQFKPGTDEKAAPAPFDPEQFRVTLADLERATSFQFGPELRQAAAQRRAAPPDPWRRDVAAMNAPDPATRIAATQRLANILRDPAVAVADKRALVASAANLAIGGADAPVSPSGRINVLVLLTEAPPVLRNQGDWLETKALVRRMAATMEAQAGITTEPIGPQTADLLAKLKTRLDWDLAKGRTVYFQYSGTSRASARAVSNDLRALGWSIPGEEDVGLSRARNGVYYTDKADLEAATLLAADLRAQGQDQVGPPQQIKGGKPGILEAWISP